MARKNVSAIVSGAGWLGSFAGILIDGLRQSGCSDEEIHGLITSRSKFPMERIVKEVAGTIRDSRANILAIDRTAPFDPAMFLGRGWTIWKGPADDGLSGKEEQDERSLAITHVGIPKILLETSLNSDESHITGEERIRRLGVAGRICLDAKIFQTLNYETLKTP